MARTQYDPQSPHSHTPLTEDAGPGEVPGVVAVLRSAARWAAMAVLVAGGLSLMAWVTGASSFQSLRSGRLAIRPSTATSFILASVSVLLMRDERAPRTSRAAALLCAGAVVAAGLLYLAQYAAGTSVGFETLFPLHAAGAAQSASVLRMPPPTAALFVALGSALLALDWEDRKGWRPAQPLCILVALFAIAAFGTRLFDVVAPSHTQPLPWITPLTSLSFVLLSLGALAARPDRGRMRVVTADAVGGDVARRLLPAAMLGPLLLCVLCYIGYRVKWYDSAFGLALLTASNSAVLTALVWRTAVSLNDADAQRSALEQERHDLNARLQRSMAETHHRVRNNLQFIAALADLQVLAGREMVPVSEVKRIGAQVNALAAIHAILTRESKSDSGADRLSAAEVIGKLAEQLRTSAHGRGISVQADDTEISGRQASALVIIINELVTNALKNSSGDVYVEFGAEEGRARLVVWDEGRGFPEGFDPVKEANTGLELVQQMSSWDLQGTVCFTNRPEGGARVIVELPLAPVASNSPVAA